MRLRERITMVEPTAMSPRERPPMVMSSWPLAPVRGSWGTGCLLLGISALYVIAARTPLETEIPVVVFSGRT